MDVDLGFYDQQEEENRYRPQQKTKKGSYFFTGLIGAVVGALLVIFTIPTLSNVRLLPYSVEPINGVKVKERESGSDKNTITQDVSLEVETGITGAVEKAGDAV